MIGWATPRDVAMWVGRPERTIRNWVAAGLVASRRHPETGAVLVDVTSAEQETGRRGKRKRGWRHAA